MNRTIVNGNRLAEVGFKYIGTPYSQMDCQAFVEKCLADCGNKTNLAGSNAWFREVRKNGWTGTPEECCQVFGGVPAGAFLFILKQDGGEPAKYKPDGIGNASHIGICTGKLGEGAIHSSSSRGMVCESKFRGKTIPNGGWNMVGLWDSVDYIEFPIEPADPQPEPDPAPEPARRMLRKGCKGEDVFQLQLDLMALGYDLEPCGADGEFGSKTQSAVIAFQNDHGLDPDGIAGPLTFAAIDEALAEETAPILPDWRYTVTIAHLTKEEAEELCRQWSGAEMTRENG